MQSVLEMDIGPNGKGKILLDGNELKGCRSITFHSEAGKINYVTLKMFVHVKGKVFIEKLSNVSSTELADGIVHEITSLTDLYGSFHYKAIEDSNAPGN